MIRKLAMSTIAFSTMLVAAPALAKDPPPPPVTLEKCSASLGTIAMVDGDTQGWLKFGLGSPRWRSNPAASRLTIPPLASPRAS